jgi:hypothetical protein
MTPLKASPAKNQNRRTRSLLPSQHTAIDRPLSLHQQEKSKFFVTRSQINDKKPLDTSLHQTTKFSAPERHQLKPFARRQSTLGKVRIKFSPNSPFNYQAGFQQHLIAARIRSLNICCPAGPKLHTAKSTSERPATKLNLLPIETNSCPRSMLATMSSSKLNSL